jgi:hypothetical protein
MAQNHLVGFFEKGDIITPDKVINAEKLSWSEHPAFKGVYLKDLVTSADTNGAFSCHLVKVNGGCSVGEHSHEKEWEFNEILNDSGAIVIADKRYPCKLGLSCINPPGISHTVIAGDDDLYLLAKFMPALK